MSLQAHPYLEATNPAKYRLVSISQPFPAWLNPFYNDGVVIRAGIIPGDTAHSKSYVARELIVGGIEKGEISNESTIVEASSGNIGQGIAAICNALRIKCRIIMSGDTPTSKLNAVRAIGRYVELILHLDEQQSTVERARREGTQPGYYNPDQYANPLNPLAHQKYLAPQLFARAGKLDAIAVASGTMGTSLGLKAYAEGADLTTTILPVVCAEREEVPGTRSLSRIRRDVQLPWEKSFLLQDIECGTRHESFVLAYLSWRWLPKMLGPSFGLAFFGALKRIWKAKEAGTLDKFRNVLVLGADSYELYPDVIFGELLNDEFSLDLNITSIIPLIKAS